MGIENVFKENEKRKQEFIELAEKMLDPVEIDAIAFYLDRMGYFVAPAGKVHHGAYTGGLYEHSKAVAAELENLTEKLGLVWQRKRSPFIIGFLHDICKTKQYDVIADGDGYHIEYNKKNILPGHGETSVYLLHEMEHELNMRFTEEELMCIRYHMGAYTDKSEWNHMDAAIKEYPNIIYTHTADMIAAKITGI